jgi:WD40 repeat protein
MESLRVSKQPVGSAEQPIGPLASPRQIQTGNCDTTYMDLDGVLRIGVLPDGRIINNTLCGKLKIWNLQSRKCDIIYSNNLDYYKFITIFPDGSILFESLVEKTLKIWNPIERGSPQSQQLQTKCDATKESFLTFNSYLMTPIILPNDRLLVQSQNFTLDVLNIHTGVCIAKFREFKATWNNVYFKGRIVSQGITENNQLALKMWNAQTGICDSTFVVCSSFRDSFFDLIEDLIVLPDGRIVVVTDYKNIKICNLLSGKYDISFTAHSKSINNIAVLPDGRIVTGSDDETIKIWS